MRPRLIRCLALLLLASLAFLSGFCSFLLLEEKRIASLLFSIGYVLAWTAYTFLARRMRLWNVPALIIAGGTVIIAAEVLLLTYTAVGLPDFLLVPTIVLAISTLYPLLGFSAIGLFSAPGLLGVVLLAAIAWCALCIRALSRKTPANSADTTPEVSGKTE